MKDIFTLEMDEGAPLDQLDAATPHISLNAIMGISAIVTMKLPVHITDTSIVALVDSGSTHSFISLDVANLLHLLLLHCPSLHVTMANDDQVASANIYKDIRFSIGSEEFVMDFIDIPLADFDMVLGVQWLRTLDLILRDFEHACWRVEHCVVWQRVSSHRDALAVHTMVLTYLMPALLQEFDDVFSTPTDLPPPQSLYPSTIGHCFDRNLVVSVPPTSQG
jgi:hypothetical protein